MWVVLVDAKLPKIVVIMVFSTPYSHLLLPHFLSSFHFVDSQAGLERIGLSVGPMSVISLQI